MTRWLRRGSPRVCKALGRTCAVCVAALCGAQPAAPEPDRQPPARAEAPQAATEDRAAPDETPRAQQSAAAPPESRIVAERPVQPVPAGRSPATRRVREVAVTLDDAAAIVRQSYGGRIVQRARLGNDAQAHRGTRFRIRVDIGGRVKTVFVDAAGRIHERPPRQGDARPDR